MAGGAAGGTTAPAFPDKPVAHLLGSNGPIHTVAYSASPGTYILTGSSDRSIRLYNPHPSTSSTPHSHITKPPTAPIPPARLVQTYASAHGHAVLALAVASDNARFASAGGDRAVFLWDVATANTLRRFGGQHGHSSRVNCVALAGEGDALVVSGGFDCSVRIWDAKAGGGGREGGKPVMVLSEARDGISAVVVHGAEVVSGSVDGRVRSYDVRMGRCVTDVVCPDGGVTSLCMGRDGRTVLVGGLDSKVRLMDREGGGCLKAYGDAGWRNEELRVQSVLGGKERWVVAGDEMTAQAEGDAKGSGAYGTSGSSNSPNGRVWAWDVLTGKVVAKLDVPWGPEDEGQPRKRVLGRDGKEKEQRNVVSCLAWKMGGYGDEFCVGSSSGVATVFGPRDAEA